MNIDEIFRALENDEEFTRVQVYIILREFMQHCQEEMESEHHIETIRWYAGNVNAFRIALDLIEHMEII